MVANVVLGGRLEASSAGVARAEKGVYGVRETCACATAGCRRLRLYLCEMYNAMMKSENQVLENNRQ